MTDHESTYEQEMENFMKSKHMGKKITTHFEPALNKRAEDIYSWVNLIVKKDWPFETVNEIVF